MSFFEMNNMFGKKEVDVTKFMKPASAKDKSDEDFFANQPKEERKLDSNYLFCKERSHRIHIDICRKNQNENHCDCDAKLAFDIRQRKNETQASM
jgi:hypothetical protein